ncbi:hypothetical protein ACLGI4_04830 [Streptomyces sp. HMX112]|uniref:hypothetical protein n=1 Tax=Streptomyces sp. HMX112 TaxID=3390850 RepID=UPI003A800F71
MTRTTATTHDLNTGLDDFLARARTGQGVTLPARPADAVLTLLALRGADRRTGVPEPTPELLRRVLHEDLPGLLHAGPDELAMVPAVFTALADRVRAANRLNAKRHARLLAAVDEAVPEFRRAMADPHNLTWPRWYAALLDADGVDTSDPAAVRAWLAAHAAAPRAERPPLPPEVRRANVACRTFTARTLLTEALLAAPAPETASGTSPAAPAWDADELEQRAAELTDRWTAAGLSAALAGPYAELAPGPEELPHAALADLMLNEHLDYYGYSGVPLPPLSGLPAPEEVRGLVHAAPLPAALASGAVDPSLRELAERCGFPGPASAVWAEGTPGELTELAADVLAATVERVAADAEPSDPYALDAAHLLYSLHERGGTPESVARKASDMADWPVDPELEDAPFPVPDSAPAEYTAPSARELSALLRHPEVTEAQRGELAAHARELAAVVDRLAGTGCVFRTGDAYGLTALGKAVMCHVMAVAGIPAPGPEDIVAWDAHETVAAVRNWPPAIAAAAVTAWTAGRGGTDEAWAELLAAVSAAKAGTFHDISTPTLLAHLDLAGVPAGPLHAALADPVTGAYVQRFLASRGADVAAEGVPLGARAILVLDELHLRWTEDMRAAIAVAAEGRAAEPVPSALLDAFDTAAADWPGGAPALVRALAAADPAGSARLLEDLRDRHPDSRVAEAAGRAVRTARSATGARKRRAGGSRPPHRG